MESERNSAGQLVTLWTALGLLVATCCFGFAGVAKSKALVSPQTPCVVGQPRNIGHRSLYKPADTPRVIACGRSFLGPFEIVAFTSLQHNSLCTLFLGGPFMGEGDCAQDGGVELAPGLFSPSGDDEMCVLGIWWESGRQALPSSITYLHGSLSPAVTRVEIRYQQRGNKSFSRVSATVARVNGELLKSLDQASPFGRFAAVLPGYAVLQRTQIVAYDSEGHVVETQRGHRSRSVDLCRP